MKKIIYAILLIGCGSCLSKEEPFILKDSAVQAVLTAQYQRNTEALTVFLSSDKAPKIRELAAIGLASVQDPKALPQMVPLLADPDKKVRSAIAYAIGQTADTLSSSALQEAIGLEKDPEVLSSLLEALGKCATSTGLQALVNYEPFAVADSLGKVKGLYRAGLRNHLSFETAQIASFYLIAPTHQIREMAAHFFARFRNTAEGKDFLPLVKKQAQLERNPEIRAALVMTLLPSKELLSQNELEGFLNDSSHLVRINALRLVDDKSDEAFFCPRLLKMARQDPNQQVKLLATEKITAFCSWEIAEWKEVYWSLPEKQQVILLKSQLNSQKEETLKEAKKIFIESTDVYTKGLAIQVLAKDASQIGFIAEVVSHIKTPLAVKTQAFDALLSMDTLFHLKTSQLKEEVLARALKAAIGSHDVGLVYSASIFLRDESHQAYLPALGGISFLEQHLDMLKLPIDIEAYQELAQTIAFFKNESYERIAMQKEWYKPLDWSILEQLPFNASILFTTNKGEITVRLFPVAAPGTVAMLLQLVNDGFYNGKTFHRVVPNFVAQGGCPRGDGYGGLEQGIRSEFAPLNYKKGSCGIASAGKDTESCQFFITHVATPHLDGRYTIFGEVAQGFEVVEQLAIGDKIISAKVIAN